MTASSWIHLDDLRESWVFLLLGEKQSEVSPVDGDTQLMYWELGVGNADELVRTEAAQVSCEGVVTEADLLETLLTELDQYRYQGTVLITPTRSTVQKLRRRLVASDREHPSLRGLAHIGLEEQLSQYFGRSLTTYDFDPESRSPPRVTETDPEQVVSTGSVKAFWECWQRVFRLLPTSELVGEEL